MTADRSGPDAAAFAALAHRALDEIAPRFRRHLEDAIIRIEEFAAPETLRSVGIEDRWGLTGLYEGRPLTEQSIWTSGEMPPVITLYRAPLLREQRETGVPLADLVKHVVIHEAGHHFGFSDEEMEALEQEDD